MEEALGILRWQEDFQYLQWQSLAGATQVHFQVGCISLACQWWAAASLWETVLLRDC